MKKDDLDLTPIIENVVLKTILNNSTDTIYFKDLKSRFIYNSRAHVNQLNELDTSMFLGKTDFDYFPPQFAKATYDIEQNIIKTGQPQIDVIEKWDKPNGDIQWLMSSKYPLYDEEDNIIGTWGISKDITKLKEAEEQLVRLNNELTEANHRLEILSIRDGLSGLYNHRHLFETLQVNENQRIRHINHGQEMIYSLVVFDVDDFKNINDTYGHLSGDKVINQIAGIILKNTRASDMCFRTGGDEFAILLINTSLQSAFTVAEHLRQVISKHDFILGENSINITISAGVSTCTQANSIDEFVGLADTRMYVSKNNGKNKVSK